MSTGSEGWSAVRDDHPARHGEANGPFLARIGTWWGALLVAMRERASTKGDDVT